MIVLTRNSKEHYENISKPHSFIRKFINFKLDEYGNFIGMSYNNPNNVDKTHFCMNTPCPSQYSAIDSVCWVCVNEKEAVDDFRRMPPFEEALKDYIIL